MKDGTEHRPRRARPEIGAGDRHPRGAGLPPFPSAEELRAALAEARPPEAEPPPAEAGPAAEPTAGPAPVAASTGAPIAAPAPGPAAESADDRWERLATTTLDPRHLERHLVISAARTDPAHGAFDVLRTKTTQALAERGWRRVGITSPTKGCGKSFTAANLAVSLSRTPTRTVLLDLDLHLPSLARVLGVAEPGAIGDLLRGLTAPDELLRRVAPNRAGVGPSLAIGLNARPEPFAAELFHQPSTAAALARIEAELAPQVMLIDLPPALAQDDVIALKPHLNCVLMVAAGGETTPRELREAVRRLGRDLPILGVVLNKAEGEGIADYRYSA
jgi:Mrp family chromosome partitioning ATPase